MRLRMVVAVVLVVGVVGLGWGLIPAAQAAEIRAGERIVVAADEVIDDDLVVTAQLVQIDGTVTGDLVASGSTVIVNGTVGGSAMLAGQTVAVGGQVDGSLYVGAYALELNEGAVIGRNAYFGGFSAALRPDSQVLRSFYATAYQVIHDGFIGRNLIVNAAALHVNGTVEGGVYGEVSAAGTQQPRMLMPGMPVTVEVLAPGLVIGSTAQIAGEMAIREVTPAAQPETGLLGLPLWLSERLGQLFGLLVVGLILVIVTPRLLPALGGVLARKPVQSLGWGALVYVLLFPVGLLFGIIAVIALTAFAWLVSLGEYTVAVLGLSVGFYLFALFAFLFYVYTVAWLVVGHWLGRWLLGLVGVRSAGRAAQFGYLLLGVLLLQAARLVPVLSVVLAFVVGTLALGAVVVWWLERRKGMINARSETL